MLDPTALKVAARAKNAARGGISFTQAESAAYRALKTVGRPAGRDRSLQEMVKAVAKNDVLMTWFSETVKEHGRLSYNDTQDVLGQPILKWREGWEVDDENSPYEDMSGDSKLVKGIEQAVKKWKPKGKVDPGRDYSDAQMTMEGLNRLIRDLASGRSYDEEKDRKEALKRAQHIAKILK